MLHGWDHGMTKPERRMLWLAIVLALLIVFTFARLVWPS